MTMLRPVFTAAAALALFTVPTHGTTIYSETFTTGGATALNGTAPDVTTGGNNWTASEWLQNGTISASGTGTTNDDGAYLAFTPASGKVYTLSATMTAPTGGATTGWVGLGFAASNTASDTSLTGNGASPWMLWRPNPANTSGGQISNDVVSFTGAGATGAASEGVFTGTRTLSIVLDTTQAFWEAEWFVGSSSVRNFTFTTNPTINYVGFARENGQTSTITNFSLTVVPEPTTALAGLLLAAGLLRRRRGV